MLFIVLIVITWLLPVSKPYYNLDFYYAPWILFAAVCGIVFILDLSMILNQSFMRKPLVYIGEHTMSILIWHFSVFKIVSLIYVICHHMPVSTVGMGRTLNSGLYMHGYGWIVYSIAGVSIPLLVSYINSKLRLKRNRI